MADEPELTPWDRHAGWWQDGFTDGADPEYVEQILPLAATWLRGRSRVIDVGCGEGQLSRLATEVGATSVVGVDPTEAQVGEAVRRGGGPAYTRAASHQLPFRARRFDAAVACLVFEHVDRLDESLTEIARVLCAGGRFLLFLNHPLLQTPGSGWIDDQIIDPPEKYWRVGPYLVEQRTVEEVEPGVHIEFVHRTLSRYVNGLVDAGLVLRHMEEPPPPPGFLVRAPEYTEAATIPRLLLLVAEKT